MNSNEIIMVVVTISLGILFIILGILLRSGKLNAWVNGGSFMWFLWRKYSTYNIPAVTKLLGSMFLAIAALIFAIGLSGIFDVVWLTTILIISIIAIFAICMIYANKNHKFKNAA